MRVNFVIKDVKPERMLAEAEIEFGDDTPLAGMKLVGFSVWRDTTGEDPYVTFPSRGFGAGPERRFYDYLRSTEGNAADGRRVKDWIIEEWKAKGGR